MVMAMVRVKRSGGNFDHKTKLENRALKFFQGFFLLKNPTLNTKTLNH